MRRAVLALTVAVAALAAQAEGLRGRVVGVADGDTLTVLLEHQQSVKVRLAEIDAPEKTQAFGRRSKESLAALCFGRAAVIEDKGRDRYGRVIGRTSCAGIDASGEQVRRGMAWVFDRYATDLSLYTLQDEAKADRRGLWRDPAPVPPWDYRAASRHRHRTPKTD